MRVAIMQPYFLPYIGYFQLMSAVDTFVIYDNIEYTKKGWINRNKILLNGKSKYISLPLQKDSDYVNIDNRCIYDGFKKSKMLNQIKGTYNSAPQFKNIFPLVESIINHEENNLFKFIKNSIFKVCEYLEINTKVIDSSLFDINHDLKGEQKVIAICKSLNASTYINPIGGRELYNKEQFSKNEINLKFLKPEIKHYKQFDSEFVGSLSLIDVMMFNDLIDIDKQLNNYTLK